MDNSSRCLQLMVRRIAELARRFDTAPEITVDAVHDVIASFDTSILRNFVPAQKQFPGLFSRAVSSFLDTPTRDPSGIKYADIYQDDYCHINVFGLIKSEVRIPLHDHPDQNAVMRVFQGSVKIRSFTIINDSDEEVSESGSSESGIGEYVKVRYEGETVLSSRTNQDCAILGPNKGNIHEVIAMEPHTYFCDFFLPNAPSAHYFRLRDRDIVAGQIVNLMKIRCPKDFHCDSMIFPSFQPFEDFD